MIKKELINRLALIGFMGVSALGLVSCHSTPQSFVACSGVSADGKPINMPKGTCEKLADSKATSLPCTHWVQKDDQYVCQDPASQLTVPHYPQSDYVKCYGVAAAGKNDCGTATTACGGSVSVARQKDAWIAIPDGICKQIKGATSTLETKGS